MIKIIKACNFKVGEIVDLGQERNERAVRLGLAVWNNEKPKAKIRNNQKAK